MMTYKDKCFCTESKAGWMRGEKLCENTKCDRHASNIPFDKLPKWERFCISNFSEKCGKFESGAAK